MFFERLKVACVQKGTSPTTLLKKLGMSTSSVTAWKRGVSPSIGTIYRLAEALAVDPKMLLDDGQPINLEAENAPALTEKDRRDVAKDVARIMSSLEAMVWPESMALVILLGSRRKWASSSFLRH